MQLKDRLNTIIIEQGLKQKEFASALKISESYISNILNGKRTALSASLAALIEEIYGYNAKWLLSGDEPKYIRSEKSTSSVIRSRIIEDVKTMDDAELSAVLAFIRSLDNVKSSFGNKD